MLTYRNPDMALGAVFATIARQAGLPEIPRPFVNMRRTRSNEIRKRWGAALESEWIGHSEQTAQEHYLVIEDSEYEEASQWAVTSQKTQTGKKVR